MDINKSRRATTVFFGGVILSAFLEPVQAVTPAQTPLSVGIPSAKPNIMLMIDNSMSMAGTRLATVKTAATSFVNSLTPATGDLPTVRLGLSQYNGTDGGELLTAIGDLDAAQATLIAGTSGKISGISANANTPLAETLSDIGHYFTSGVGTGAVGYTGGLKLHPATNTATTPVVDIFKQGPLNGTYNDHNIKNSTGTSTLNSPIQGACQKSAVIILSDGLPSSDQDIGPAFIDYDGDCHNADGTYNSTKCSTFDMKNAYAYPGTNSVTTPVKKVSGGGSNSSDYLDDVAQALYEMDLRPDLVKTNGEINNLVTHTVGFADPAIDPSIPGVNPLLKDTAAQGGGKFIYATDVATLTTALKNIATVITTKIGSASAVAANSAQLVSGSAIFQGKFDSADWTGSLSMIPLGASEDVNGNGVLDFTDSNNNGKWDIGEPTEDTNGNGILDGGMPGTASWNAAEHIPAFVPPTSTTQPEPSTPARNIFTYSSAVTPKGVTFECANLTASQKTALGIANCSSITDQGVWRLNYLRGDWRHEEVNPARTDAETNTPQRSATAVADRIFRNRTHLTKTKPLTGVLPDPWLLGDIVNSTAVYVGNENYGYDKLPTVDGGGTTYKDFVTANASRRKMIYVGANDGMLHGFDASASGTDAGKEILAYVPNAVYGKLNLLSSPSYTHQYSVDGSPRVADAYFGGAWHTLLVSTTGAGGKAVFGLDVTSPSSFGGSHVLWEISDTGSPTALDLITDTTTLRGFANNLGYTLPQASIVKMHDGSWAAIVANGYGSANNLAVLYIINAQTGSLIRAIDTAAGGATAPNGLSTPISVDTNGDRIVDAIYAGDLQGNMWKFDVSDTVSPNNWHVANAGAPLFIACSNQASCATTRQPITAKPQVGGVGAGQAAGVMVYFGTGKYFETIDNNVSNAQTQSFYGIWDNNATVAQTALQVQTITQIVATNGVNYRATTNTTVNYPTQKGWYMDLPSAGERVVSAPLLRNGRIIFPTLIPVPPVSANICGAGSESTGWLMELDALSGGRLPASGTPWDTNGDGMINPNDLITLADGTKVAPGGIQLAPGAAGSPTVVKNGKIEYKILSITQNAGIRKVNESSDSSASGSRQSWLQVQ